MSPHSQPGIDPAAHVSTSHDLLVRAPVSRVWDLQTDVAAWPTWQPPVLTAERLDSGPLVEGARFRWTTPVPASELSPADTLVITSTVRQVEHHRYLRWTGPATGEHLAVEAGVHVWTFTEVDGGTLVHTEESWAGAIVDAHPAEFTAALAASLESWLANLQAAAERPAA